MTFIDFLFGFAVGVVIGTPFWMFLVALLTANGMEEKEETDGTEN